MTVPIPASKPGVTARRNGLSVGYARLLDCETCHNRTWSELQETKEQGLRTAEVVGGHGLEGSAHGGSSGVFRVMLLARRRGGGHPRGARPGCTSLGGTRRGGERGRKRREGGGGGEERLNGGMGGSQLQRSSKCGDTYFNWVHLGAQLDPSSERAYFETRGVLMMRESFRLCFLAGMSVQAVGEVQCNYNCLWVVLYEEGNRATLPIALR